MSTLSKHLKNSILQEQQEPVNESLILGAIVATACIGYAAGPMFSNDFFKSVGAGLGGLLGGLGAMFAGFGQKSANKKEDDNKDSKKEDDKKSDDGGSTDKDVINTFSNDPKAQSKLTAGLLMMAKKANDSEKDETKKKENDSMLKLLTACSFDKDGNEIPMEERLNKMKDIVPEEQFEEFKGKLNKAYEDNKDSKEFKEALEKAKGEITSKDLDEYIKSAKEEAKKSWKEIEESKAKQKEMDEEIARIEKELENAEGDDKTKLEKELQTAQAKKEETTQQSFIGKLGSALGIKSKSTGSGEPDPQDPPQDPPAGSGEPKTKTKEEIDAEIDAIDKEYAKKQKDLDDEYQQKIENESDETKKQDLQKELEKKKKSLKAEMNKKKDDVDDTDEHKDDDETKQGKYTVKDEEIEDPETGEKIKVKTFTGPRGGKFYYPKGKPKKPENKVYVESVKYNNLSNYLSSAFN